MTPAFVTGPAVSSRTSFTGAALSTCAKPASSTVTMSAQPMSRRQALITGAALIAGAPLAALAKSGDSPKLSIFGVGGASSPFEAGVQKGGTKLYKEFNNDELEVLRRIVNNSKDRIAGAEDSIKTKSWEDIRSRVRLEAGELRKVQNKINDGLSASDDQVRAKKAARAVKIDLEQLDQACVQKNQDAAYKKYNSVLRNIDAWKDTVGI